MVTSANVACGFHAGDPATLRRVCALGGRARRRDRRAGRLPRPGRLRPPLHRRRAGRADRRRDLPDRRAGRLRPRSRAPGCATSSRTARSTTRSSTTRRRRRRSSRRSGRTTPTCRCWACPARPWLAAGRRGRAARRCPRRSPTAPTPGGHAGVPPRARRRAARPGRGRRRAASGWSPTARSTRSTARASPVRRRLDLRARRHPGRGGDGPGGTRRARGGRRPDRAVRRAGDRGASPVRLLPCGDRPCWSSSTTSTQVLALLRRARRDPRRRASSTSCPPRAPCCCGSARADVSAAAAGRAALRSARPSEGAAAPTTTPVRDPGDATTAPDLAEVGGAHRAQRSRGGRGRTPGRSGRWRSAASRPGFGYLVGGDARLHVAAPRTPRTAVPAGAVGLAGEFTGVYPGESPGGWQLIGRTAAPTVGPRPRPAGAAACPGTRVRFAEAT